MVTFEKYVRKSGHWESKKSEKTLDLNWKCGNRHGQARSGAEMQTSRQWKIIWTPHYQQIQNFQIVCCRFSGFRPQKPFQTAQTCIFYPGKTRQSQAEPIFMDSGPISTIFRISEFLIFVSRDSGPWILDFLGSGVWT